MEGTQQAVGHVLGYHDRCQRALEAAEREVVRLLCELGPPDVGTTLGLLQRYHRAQRQAWEEFVGSLPRQGCC